MKLLLFNPFASGELIILLGIPVVIILIVLVIVPAIKKKQQSVQSFTTPADGTPYMQQAIINLPVAESNGIGTAGFVMAIIALFLSWVPVLGWILWFLGVLFSFIGIFKNPKGLAITGLILSFIGLIILLVVVSTIIGAFSTMFSPF